MSDPQMSLWGDRERHNPGGAPGGGGTVTASRVTAQSSGPGDRYFSTTERCSAFGCPLFHSPHCVSTWSTKPLLSEIVPRPCTILWRRLAINSTDRRRFLSGLLSVSPTARRGYRPLKRSSIALGSCANFRLTVLRYQEKGLSGSSA